MRGAKRPRYFIAETIDLKAGRTRPRLVVMEHHGPRRHPHLARASCGEELLQNVAPLGHGAGARFYGFAGITRHVRVVENARRQGGDPTYRIVRVDVAYGMVLCRHGDRPHPGRLSNVVQHPSCALVKDVGGEAVNRVPHLFVTTHGEASHAEEPDRRSVLRTSLRRPGRGADRGVAGRAAALREQAATRR